jgi:excinuclease UvrABC ATPase subunit
MGRGRKPKENFKDPDILLIVEGLARDGLDNKDIAKYFNYGEATFSRIINSGEYEQLSQALKKGRKPLEIVVENSLYRRATGQIKLKTQVRRFLEQKCTACQGEDPKCKVCKGTGKMIITDIELVQETISEVPPDTGAAALWLKQKKPNVWNKQPEKVDVTSLGESMAARVLTKKEARELLKDLENEF